MTEMPPSTTAKRPDRIKWHFPPTGGGVAQGFNDSGQEIFKANVPEHVVREIIQNSLDAKSPRYPDRPVVVKMQKIELMPGMLGTNEIARHVDKSLERVTEQNNPKGIRFYKKAQKMLKRSKIPTLKVVDENTTGLDGKKWEALVYQEGTPLKDMVAAGGSYGIGKNAPYAASALSLVCYSTRYLNQHRTEMFISRCKLVAHENPGHSGQELQHVGFGTSKKFDGKCFPPVEGNGIHEAFRLDCSGTGIFIVGFTEPDWQAAAKSSIACNFFAAIHDKKLSVQVGGSDITNETLHGEDFGDEGHRHYYDLYKNSDKPIPISGDFGRFYLKISTDEKSMENRVAYINRRGMLITAERTFNKNPFHVRLGDIGKYAAIVWAADDKTDERIRGMEPPTHEIIEYWRIADTAERKSAKSALMKINYAICEEIKKKLNIDALEQKTELTELADIIPLLSEPDKDKKIAGGNGRGGGSKPAEHIDLRKIHLTNRITAVEPDGGNGDMDDNGGGRTSGASGGDPRPPRQGKKKRATANMENVRIVRHGGMLRVAFTPKTGANKFAVRPAGEEYKNEDTIPVTDARNVSGNAVSLKLSDNTITVDAAKNKRVVLDIPLDQAQYTGYNIVEYETRRRKK